MYPQQLLILTSCTGMDYGHEPIWHISYPNSYLCSVSLVHLDKSSLGNSYLNCKKCGWQISKQLLTFPENLTQHPSARLWQISVKNIVPIIHRWKHFQWWSVAFQNTSICRSTQIPTIQKIFEKEINKIKTK